MLETKCDKDVKVVELETMKGGYEMEEDEQ